MSLNSKPTTAKNKVSAAVSKSISIPKDLLGAAFKQRIEPDPEMDLSKYVRGLIRRDLESAELTMPGALVSGPHKG